MSAARQRHLRHRALGVGAFGHGFLIDRLDLVAEMLFDGEPALVVLVGPAAIADRADIDEADLHRLPSVAANAPVAVAAASAGRC